MKRRAEAGEETGLRVVEEEETEAEAGKQAEVEEEVEEASPGPGPRLVWTGGSSCGGQRVPGRQLQVFIINVFCITILVYFV